MRRENGKTAVVCIWSMISGGIKQDSLRLKSVLTSVEHNLGFDGEVLVFSSLVGLSLVEKFLVLINTFQNSY